MGNPLSHYDFRHTCPTCNRPVKHGDKFCEVCGTKIPSLSTCSKCGTQFIHPKKFCDLCGAPFILEEVLEPEADEIQVPVLEEIPVTESDEVPEPAEEETLEPDEEEIPEPAEEEIPEQDEEEIPEQDEEEIPEQDEEEIPEPAEKEIPEQDEEEIPEPDTDELLKQFGEEYGDDETLESNNKPKPTSPLQHEAKKPVTVPALQRRGSSKTADDALFLLDTEPAPAKPPVNKIRIIGGGIVLITILAAVFFIGLPMLTGIGVFSAHSNPTAAEITPIPTIASLTVKPTPASRALIPQPTQLNPADQKFRFQVRKDPITSKITVIFTGSAGEGSITSADVKVTHANGSVTMGIILPLKGVSDITLDGSKETDRVEIIAKMTSGETYRVYDDLVSFIK
jgi:hypothetical protein